jgi:hypothetical protein
VTEDPLSPELAGYQKQFTANRREAAALCAGLSRAQFNWRPEPHRWSIAECLLHLNVGAEVYTRLIEMATERGRTRGLLATGPFRYGFLSRWLLGSLEPPVRTRYKTPRMFYPAPGVQHMIADVLRQFESAGRRWDECLRRANGLDLARVKVPSPVVPLLRFQLGPLFAGQAAHERRHLWQGMQVRAATGFPET